MILLGVQIRHSPHNYVIAHKLKWLTLKLTPHQRLMLSVSLRRKEITSPNTPPSIQVCVFINVAYSADWQLQQQMFANVQEWFSVHLNEIICSEHPPSSDCSDKKQTPSLPPSFSHLLLLLLLSPPRSFYSPSLSLSLSLYPPNKETNREPNKPVAIPLQCSHPHPGLCQVGEIIGIV